MLTANIAAYFVEEDDNEYDRALHAKPGPVVTRLDSLEAQLDYLRNLGQAHMPETEVRPEQMESEPIYAEAVK